MRVDTCCLYKRLRSKGFIWWSEITLHCFLSGIICNRVIRQRNRAQLGGGEAECAAKNGKKSSVCMDMSIL